MRDMLLTAFAGYGALPFSAKVGVVLSVPLLTTIVGLVVAIRMPADAFGKASGTESGWPARGQLLRWLVRNGLGACLFGLGVILALPLVPGPGALFMLLGLSLADFPGKRRLQLRLLRLPPVLPSINRLRARFGRPPLVDPPS
jgi:hypothetical protein